MGTSKRQRQDIGRQQRLQELESQKKVQKRKAGLKRYGLIAAGIVVVMGLLLVLNQDDDATPVATDVTTTVAGAPGDASTTSAVAVPSTVAGGAPISVPRTAPGLESKPVVTTPTGTPPAEPQKTDLVVGKGAEASGDSIVQMQYVGVAWSTGKEFDSSWSRNAEPFDVDLAKGGVIKGWLDGIPGMRVGGRRQLVIPPSHGYGDRGAGADIKPGETLVFVVDLVSVTAPSAGEVVVGGSTTTVPGPSTTAGGTSTSLP